jgi:hypothetical protein
MTIDARIALRVGEFVATLERSAIAKDVLGVVLSGSGARREEIWRAGELVSDIDLMVLTRRTSPRLIKRIDALIKKHRGRGIDGGQVPLGPLANYLTLSFFEARANGVVVSGDVDLSLLIPATASDSLPLWEGVRVLGNRLLEHVKYTEGLIEPSRVVAKSYEALSEAYLVAERRYRPSYTERLAELERQAPDAPAPAVDNMISALRSRLGIGPQRNIPVPAALADLVLGLGRVAGAYSALSGDAATQLAELATSECHWRHRLYWSAITARQRRWSTMRPFVDPIIQIWQRALAMSAGSSTSRERLRLLDDWRACPQILVRRPR